MNSEERFNITSFFTFRNVPGQYSDFFIKKKLCVKMSEDERQVKVCTATEDNDYLRTLTSYHYPKSVIYYSVSQQEFVQFIGTILEKKLIR